MTDVIFLQKRDTLRQQDEPWLHLAEAVSYTHLDVYKRQGIHLFQPLAAKGFACKSY